MKPLRDRLGRPAQHAQVGRLMLVYPRQVGVVAGSLRAMAQEMKAMMGPWPSAEANARLNLLETAARYLAPRPVVEPSRIRLLAVQQAAIKKRMKR